MVYIITLLASPNAITLRDICFCDSLRHYCSCLCISLVLLRQLVLGAPQQQQKQKYNSRTLAASHLTHEFLISSLNMANLVLSNRLIDIKIKKKIIFIYYNFL